MSDFSGREVRTRAGGRDVPRLIERLPNGLWRVDWASGLVTTYSADPRSMFRFGLEPGATLADPREVIRRAFVGHLVAGTTRRV